jgi:hypothetical protein
MEIQAALARLNSQLPLKARQDRLPATLKSMHRQVLRSLVTQGRPPSEAELKAGLDENNITAALQRLGAEDLVVLDAEGKRPLGAYPVTSERTPHKITVHGHSIHAMCALDAVSVAPMFDEDVVIESSCHVSKTPIIIHMHGNDILEVQPGADVTIGIRWQMPSAVAAHSMCMQMVFLKDRQTALAWQQGDTENISLFSLPDAVAFGKAFFLPLLE